MDTLAVRLAVPLIGPAKVFHLLSLRPAGRRNKKGSGSLRSPFCDTSIRLLSYCGGGGVDPPPPARSWREILLCPSRRKAVIEPLVEERHKVVQVGQGVAGRQSASAERLVGCIEDGRHRHSIEVRAWVIDREVTERGVIEHI